MAKARLQLRYAIPPFTLRVPNVLQVMPRDRNPELIKLALSTLGTFDFSSKSRHYFTFMSHGITGHVLNEFVRSCALPYLEEDNADIRRAAAVTCCRLFVRDPIFYSASSHAIQVISDVLNKLLTVGIADPGIYSPSKIS
jgi:FKBP12-rapamycin complex-associated protein